MKTGVVHTFYIKFGENVSEENVAPGTHNRCTYIIYDDVAMEVPLIAVFFVCRFGNIQLFLYVDSYVPIEKYIYYIYVYVFYGIYITSSVLCATITIIFCTIVMGVYCTVYCAAVIVDTLPL